MKDILFLVKPDFFDREQGPFYCPDSLPVEGMLGFYPALRELVDVRYVEFTKPRNAVISFLGEENQSLPVILIAEQNIENVKHMGLQEHNGRFFLNDQKMIRGYLSLTYQVGVSHSMLSKKMSSFESCL